MKNLLLAASVTFCCGTATAYEWPAETLPLQISLGDNVSGEWQEALDKAAFDWSASPVIEVSVRKGSVRDNNNCRARKGRVEICNAYYGNNNWLGLATLTVSGEFIESAVVRLNETYFSQVTYSDSAWRNMVMCHEVGHVFGVPHLDESWDNPPTGSCMDYTNDPSFNQSPNNEDFVILESIYDATNGTESDTTDEPTSGDDTGSSKPCRGKKCSTAITVEDEHLDQNLWGKRIGQDGRHEIFERHIGNGKKVITVVTRRAL